MYERKTCTKGWNTYVGLIKFLQLAYFCLLDSWPCGDLGIKTYLMNAILVAPTWPDLDGSIPRPFGSPGRFHLNFSLGICEGCRLQSEYELRCATSMRRTRANEFEVMPYRMIHN